MAGSVSQWVLSACVLLLVARPLSPSSRPEADTATLCQLPKGTEQQHEGPQKIPWLVKVATSLAGVVLEVLLTTALRRWWSGRKPQRRREEEKRQSPPGPAEPCCCRELLEELRHSRALLRPSLSHSSGQRPRQRRPGLCKRRRLHFSPQLCSAQLQLRPSALELAKGML